MRQCCAGMFALFVTTILATITWAQHQVNVAVPSTAGVVEGKAENSDAFMWGLFVEVTKPVDKKSGSRVSFETWASDNDTFTASPHWPEPGEPVKLHSSVLQLGKELATDGTLMRLDLRAKAIDVPCAPPVGAAVGRFPTSGTPLPCIAEQVARNRSMFDYIVNNHLYTQSGLAAAYQKSLTIDMPVEAIAVKGDWIPLAALLQWVPELKNFHNIRSLYHTTVTNSVEYALVAIHIASRQNKDWVWATFEHEMNPGRCDYIGCFDTFGAKVPSVLPSKSGFNTQYGACQKTSEIKALMVKAGVSSVWQHYCLKSTQVAFTAPDGTPLVLGNSVIEGIVGNGTVAASSCISCHYYASFGPTGATTQKARAMLPFNATGNPIPGVLDGSKQFSFMWGVLLAPK